MANKKILEIHDRLLHGLLVYYSQDCCPDQLCPHLIEKDLGTLLQLAEKTELHIQVLQRQLHFKQRQLQKVKTQLADQGANKPFGPLLTKPIVKSDDEEN